MSETAAATDDNKADKPATDNATLAFMLRESADIVEKGEFDVILYHALQDFRTYYKLHLPKRKDKTKKKATVATTTAPAGIVQNSPDAAAVSSSDAPGEASTKLAETTGKAPAAPASVDRSPQSTSAEQPKPDVPAREISAGATVVSEGTASTTPSTADPPASSTKLQSDAPAAAAAAAVEPGAAEYPINTESGRMGSMDSILDSGRSAEDFDNEASLRDAHAKQAHSFNNPFGKKTKNAGNKISAGMFATKTKMKLPKKLPKIHVNLPSSAKKKRGAELEEVTGGDVAQYAESSRRRAAADGEDYHEAEMQSPQRSTNLRAAVTGLGNTETPSTSTTTPADRVREDEPADAVNEKPSSLRDNETHNAANNASEVDSTAPSVPSTDAFVADPRPESFDSSEMPDFGHSKPAFQRSKNKTSAVVANGWIEQQRRSKMRTVWKEVLASLVQGRKPGEETTLWIQRENVDATTGKKELEALHQIPVKLLESVVYSEYTTDDRFSLKLYNSHEEFVFRCNNDPSAAMNWVTILQQYEMEAKPVGSAPTAPSESIFPDIPGFEEKKGSDMPERTTSPTPTRLAIRDLRAICHGAGINTAGMERTDLERAAAEVQKRGTFFAPPTAGHAAAASVPSAGHAPASAPAGSTTTSRSASPLPPRPSEPSAPASSGATAVKVSIKDLRAICHGAGISTVGMERGELERAAAEVQQRGTYFAPPAPLTTPRPAADSNPEDEARRKAAEDEARRKAAEEEHWRRHEEETRRRAAEDEHRKRSEEEHRRRTAEEAHRRQMAEQQARQAEDQRRRYAEQQAAWHHQQQQDEQRRRFEEQQAAEHRRRHEEAMRKQQQWAGQQPGHQPQNHQQQGWSRQQPPPQHQQQHYQHPPQQWTQQQQQQWHHQQQQQQQQYQQQQARPQAPPPQQHAPQEQSKYAKMANATEDDGQAAITKLKHDILIQWALHPPQMQMLRSVDVLLSTIQTVFPPALGVPAHDYFKKWKVVTRESILSDAGIIDEEKAKKAVRKLRFFLHPDKLPKDLNKEQEFMVRMLWDITNDAWEEYQKSKEDLDWVK